MSSFVCSVSCSRIAGTSSIYLFRCLRLGSDLRCQSLSLFRIVIDVVEIFTLMSGFGYFMY